ncbi:hypothetical protein [Absidia glauca]|uniref:Uncharacterized protein n=1 Tax=Absidia glauca TaxID=4829 RepID=A0A168MKI2_ABSGL|nr:hypothetical protein [Absidia glauca]
MQVLIVSIQDTQVGSVRMVLSVAFSGPYGQAPKKRKSEFQTGLWAELNAPKEWYLKNGVFIDEDIKKMTELLPRRGSVFTQLWSYTPDCCKLEADTFLQPIHFHTSSGAMLYFPLTS